MFQVFHTYVASVLSVCCKSRSGCCMHLQWLSTVFGCFAIVSDVCCKYFNYFGCMLQVFYLDVAKVDLVLHMLQWDHLLQSSAVVAGAPLSGIECPPPTCARKTYEARGVSACCRSGGQRVRSGWRGLRVGAPGCWHRHPDAGVCPDVRALAIPFS